MAIRPHRASKALDQTDKSYAPGDHRLRVFRRILAAGFLGMLLAGSTGCSMMKGLGKAINKSDCIDEFMIDYRNRAMAAKAWHCQKHTFKCADQDGFREGFMAGYIEVASGGPGCTPCVAPQAYWGWRYQSAQGQATVNAWFAGYPMGVKAAEQAGIGHFQQIRTSSAYRQQPVAVVPTEVNPEEPVANPFYSEEQPPQPEMLHGEPEMDLNDGSGDAIAPPQPDAVFYDTPDGFSISEVDESTTDDLVSRFNVAQRDEIVANLNDQTPAPTDNQPIEVFAPATGSDQVLDESTSATDELPFSFE